MITPALRSLSILSAIIGLSAPASAQFPDTNPLAPGFWAFPYSKDVTGEALAQSCRTGFSLYFGDGSSMSFMADGDRWLHDGSSTCTYDLASSSQSCTVEIWEGDSFVESRSESRFSVEPDGRLTLASILEGHALPLVTYPLPCPDEAVRDALSQALSPQ